MNRVKSLMISLMLGCSSVVASASDEGVEGYWASDTSIMELKIQDGRMLGVVLALKNPTYLPEEDTGRDGQVRTDDNNPDPSLRGRQIIGMSIFENYQYDDGRWQGQIYDPESGNTYQSRLKLNRDGELEIRGYIGMPMFGRTAVFLPISRCTPEIKAMTGQLSLKNPCLTAASE